MCCSRIPTHILQIFISISLVCCKGDVICHDKVNSKIRLFHNISEYHFNTITFNPVLDGFEGNYIDFKPNNMEKLEKNFFNTFDSQHIVKIYLHHQNIKKLNDGAFLFLDCLKTLDLHANKIESLSDEVFVNLNRIEELDLSENNLQEILPFTFNRTRTLKSLNLSSNKLERLSRYSFFQLRNLETLNLSFNALSNIVDKTFDYLVNLKILSLNGNKLIKISPEKWYSLFRLNVLDLSKNLLVNFDTGCRFSFGVTLNYLNLADNRLSQLNIFGMLKNMPNLSVLSIERNMWLCLHLELMLNILKGSNISYSGTVRRGAQIDGIRCYGGAEEYPKTLSSTKLRTNGTKRKIDSHINGVTDQVQIMTSIVMFLLIFLVVILFLEVLLRCNLRDVLALRGNRSAIDNSNVEHIALITR